MAARRSAAAVIAERRLSPSGDTPQNARADEIVRAAARLFDKAGYTNTSMAQIAQAVGLAKPTLYHYFASKADLLIAIHTSFMDPLIEKHEARLAAREGPEAQILGAMTDILELVENQRGHVRVFFEHHRELPRESRRLFMEKRVRYERAIMQAVADGAERGEFIVEDLRPTTLAIFGMCNWAYQWWQPGTGMSPAGIARLFANMIFYGLVPRELADGTRVTG